ncbi:urocanate hydratase [Methanobacterium sp. CWC-01]|nr:urocanate hydratase [Methanobacterium sp. CWC-01]
MKNDCSEPPEKVDRWIKTLEELVEWAKKRKTFRKPKS